MHKQSSDVLSTFGTFVEGGSGLKGTLNDLGVLSEVELIGETVTGW
jgi:hypothetical protein